MSGLRRIGILGLALISVVYLIYNEIRVRNLQGMVDLAYQKDACAPIGAERSKVESCFASNGLNAVRLFPDTDGVDPHVWFSEWMFCHSGIEIKYKNDRVVSSLLDYHCSAL